MILLIYANKISLNGFFYSLNGENALKDWTKLKCQEVRIRSFSVCLCFPESWASNDGCRGGGNTKFGVNIYNVIKH